LKELFGSAINSLSSVQYAIDSKLGEKTAVLYKPREKEYSGKKVLLIPNTNVLRANLKTLEKFNGVAIVFDSALNLHSIAKLKWLDVKRNPDVLSYKFDFIEPRYNQVFEAYESKQKRALKIKKLDILKSLVVSRSDTHFLERGSNFLYFCTSHINREFVKKYLLDYFNDKLTIDKLEKHWKELLRPDQVEYYQREYLSWLKSADGIRLKNAWLSIKETADIIKAAKKFDVDVQDLRYIQRTAKTQRELVSTWAAKK